MDRARYAALVGEAVDEMVRTFRTPGKIRREIRTTTVVHEIGHSLGLEDDAIVAEGF